jgi:hypothetical protein
MSLQHDPSAVRYSTTQDAYGTTWTYLSTDENGSQTWKNSAGQSAVVPRIEPFVLKGPSPDYSYGDGVDSLATIPDNHICPSPVPGSQPAPRAIWKLVDGQDVKDIKRNPIPDDRRRNVTVTNVILEAATVADYSKLDVEIMNTLREKGFFVNWGKIDE